MPALIAVLDACVLHPASLRDTLLRAAIRDLYRPQWSAQILDEVTRSLREDRRLTEEQANRLMAAMRRHFSEAEVMGYESLMPSLTCHEKDRHVLAAAVHIRAAVIVTSNLKDFPLSSLSPFNIEAQHPDTFLTHLFHLAPDVMVEVLQEQAATLKNQPTTFERILQTLGQHAPTFVISVRSYLQDTELPGTD